MNSKFFGGWFRSAIITLLPALALLTAAPVQAALISLNYGGLPDIAGSPDVTYDYTAGVGGTMTINGRLTAPATVGAVAVPNAGATNTIQQTISLPGLTGSAPVERLYSTNNVLVDCDGVTSCGSAAAYAIQLSRGYTNYSLIASFDANGFFTSGTVNILGYLSDATKALVETHYGQTWSDSGTILSASLREFGFYGNNTNNDSVDTLRLQFLMNLTGGDLFNLGFLGASAEYVGGVSTLATGGASPLLAAGGTSSMNWDNLTVAGQQNAFRQDFVTCTDTSGPNAGLCTSTMDTWVPIPSAVWLFGSGMLALIGFARRRK